MTRTFDVVVIGGGHGGAEAAWAASRLGAHTALVTFDRAAIGRMSCNPAIGGIGKGQMVREIDALGGLMGVVADETGIQFRMLNRRKGPALWAPRAQSDRELYARRVRERLEACPNLAIVEAGVEAIDTASGPPRQGQCTGVTLSDGQGVACRAVVVTSGTFLRALMHTGEQRTPGGRVGEAAAVGLSASLARLGLRLGRLKTGTPPRVARDSVDLGVLEEQPGDDPPTPFSFMTERLTQSQVPCWITWTTPEIHELIRANLHRAPMYSGQIASRGPRYCPSIEDKVVRFADKLRHQVFLEPEGRESERIYVNGVSTSLPQDVQARLVAGIAGLERARVLQWGYAVEYDFVPPDQIDASLMTRGVRGLFLAGQINGTTGYEEA
ncbi:MAG TPA: tRNA uridine-5-carboxymethylaminomethyl(34) synthesis enzyme MnmG, partial [Phycisphaerae bacterium]|nr:tRNA uridine-5-carboxymethylaminomethyl(34) synthesis enzyme MnmG [Phycisphaerae bacterium]